MVLATFGERNPRNPQSLATASLTGLECFSCISSCLVLDTFGERNPRSLATASFTRLDYFSSISSSVWFLARSVNAISGKPRLEALDQDSFGLSACHDFTRFFKLFDHCFDFLTQIRRHAVHLIMGAEKETENHSAVVKTDLLSGRPAKLRGRAPSKTNYALRLLTKAIAGCNVYKKVE